MPKLPGEAAVTSIAKIGEHAGGIAASNAQRKADESAASRAAAEKHPESWAEGERQKTKRTLGKTAIIAVTAIAIAGSGVYGIYSAFNGTIQAGKDAATAVGNGLSDIAEAVAPHQLSLAEVQTSIESMEWNPATGLLQSDATGSAHLHTENHILFFNQPGGTSDTYSDRKGKLKLALNDVQWSPKEISPGEFQMYAYVNESDFVVDLTDPKTVEHTEANDGFLRRVGGLVKGSNGDARQDALNDLTDSMIANKCVDNFNPALEASIKHRVRVELTNQRATLLALNNTIGVQAIEELLSKPIVVVFSGNKNAADIDLSKYADPVMTKEELARKIDSDPEYTRINEEPEDATAESIDCSATSTAVNQAIALAESEEKEIAASLANAKGSN